MSYADVNAAKRWWIMAFDCNEVEVPEDWDEPLPSDVALKFPGTETPTVLISSRAEGRASSDHPIVFTGKLKKAYEQLRSRGVSAAAIREEGGTDLFEVRDLEGHAIEICREP